MATPLSVRAFEHRMAVYRGTWKGSVVTSLLEPVLFLAAMGLGLGSLVDDNKSSLGGVTYLAFLAPGLLAAAAMQLAANEASWPVLGGLKWDRSYHAQVATPLGPRHVCLGHQLFIALRVLMAAVAFFVVMLAFGAVESPAAILAIPAAVLVGTAHSMPIAGYAVSREGTNGFAAMFRFVIIPMFLFSGTFFPISQLPAPLRPIAWVTPLWHGVSLCRGLSLGTMSAAAGLGHALYLVAFSLAGLVGALWAYPRTLTP